MLWRRFLAVLAAIVALGLTGCEFSVGGGVDDDDDDSGYVQGGLRWSWTVLTETDGDNEKVITCEEAGAEYAQLEITDSADTTRIFWWLCEDFDGIVSDPEIAAGPGMVTVSLRTYDEVVLSRKEIEFDFEAEGENDIGIIEFLVEFWDPQAAADASLTWEVRSALIENFEPGVDDPYDNAEVLTPQICAERNIDYGQLWIWNPEAEQWWTDSSATRFDCNATDRPDDPWEDDAYTGVHVSDFLAAGTYKMFLGFYLEAADEQKADMLVWYDSAGQADDDLDGVMYADGDPNMPFDNEINYYTTVFLKEDVTIWGMLKIELIWGQSQGGLYDTCDDSNVEEMGFLLRSDGWVAAEVPLGDGIECLDWLKFEDVPVLESAYSLLVSGLSKEGEYLWYHECLGLVPEEVEVIDDADGYRCEILNALAD